MGQEKEVAELGAKMDMVLESIKELKTSMNTNYVQKVQFDDLKVRVDKIENAPHKWLSTVISAVSVTVAVLALLTK